LTKQELLQYIASAGYDIGFGAKKHFASYDIIEKGPGWLGFISLIGGIYSLFVPLWATTHVAAMFVIFGVVSLYIGFYGSEKARYEDVGKELTKAFHELQVIYRTVKSMPEGTDFSAQLKTVQEIRNQVLSKSLSKQVFLSDWYAHYKFFWVAQIDWIHESRPFKFWRDKIPLTVYFTIVALVCAVGWYGISNQSQAPVNKSTNCEVKL
jgi:SMODS and SLOG-associating 2TM effector domain 6